MVKTDFCKWLVTTFFEECSSMSNILDFVRTVDETMFIWTEGVSSLIDFFDHFKKKTDAVWRINASKCTTKQGVYKEFGTVLSFPGYFGNNWDAFHECMYDLYSPTTKNYNNHYFVVENAISLTKLNPTDCDILLDILHGLESDWNFGMNRKRGVYKIFLCCSSREKQREIINLLHHAKLCGIIINSDGMVS